MTESERQYAVTWDAFEKTIEEVRSKFDDLSVEELETLVNEAVTWARRERSGAAR